MDDEFCFRAGGVTCLSSSGCSADRLRRCVNLGELRCRSRDDDDDDDGSGDESSNSNDGDGSAEESSSSNGDDEDRGTAMRSS